MPLPNERLGIALAGCGRFGAFCLSAVADLPQLLPVGVTDTYRHRARGVAGRHGLVTYPDDDALPGDERVHVIIIATRRLTTLHDARRDRRRQAGLSGSRPSGSMNRKVEHGERSPSGTRPAASSSDSELTTISAGQRLDAGRDRV
jgi:hypothetical protein